MLGVRRCLPHTYPAKRYTYSCTFGQSLLIIAADQPEVEELLRIRVVSEYTYGKEDGTPEEWLSPAWSRN